ncbi:MAG: NPCBM/NEW2 domain-containing protein [Ruminococcus sp.]|nr:NPCBM/NEW2 domain-containing protein [Ruminococcus sp.]
MALSNKKKGTITIVGVLSVIGIVTGIVANLSEINSNRKGTESSVVIVQEVPDSSVVDNIAENNGSSPEVVENAAEDVPGVIEIKEGDLLELCPPYQTDRYEEWTNLAIAGNKYASGISIGGTGNWGGEGYALFNLSQGYKNFSFDIGNIDERGVATEETLYIYLDGKVVWQLDLDPEALPTHHTIDLTGAQQMKIVGSKWAGDFGMFNLWIEKAD